MITPPRIAFITPSWHRDFERCRLLVESIERYVPAKHQHWVFVPRRDEKLFLPLNSSRTHVVVQEDVLPFWIRQVRAAPSLWLSLRSLPVRGSRIQQLVKLNACQAVDADAYACIDSRSFFVQPFDPLASHYKGGKLLLFREQGQSHITVENAALHRATEQLLGTPRRPLADRSYSSLVVYFWRHVLKALHNHVAGVHGADWRLPLLKARSASEVLLHGAFCDDVLKEGCDMYRDDRLFAHTHWGTVPLGADGLRKMKDDLPPEQKLVLLDERAGTPLKLIREVFFGP